MKGAVHQAAQLRPAQGTFAAAFVQPGTKLYTIADLSTIWVYAQVFQSDLGRIKIGDSAAVTVDAWPGQSFPGRISFIQPQVDEMTRTVKVRLEIPNPKSQLSPGMFVKPARPGAATTLFA